MKTISELIGVKNIPDLVFGIEIEAEFRNLDFDSIREKSRDFNIERDGSLLHQGLEFITRKPVPKDTLISQISTLFENKDFRNHYIESPRTSTHVHVNMLNKTVDQIMIILVCYYLLEKVFLDMCNESRRSNFFCLSLRDSSDQQPIMELIKSKFTGRLDLGGFRDRYKYSALNITPLGFLGTIEFRALQGTKNILEVQSWLDMIEKIVTTDKLFNNINEIWDLIASGQRREFVRKVLGFIPLDAFGRPIDIFETLEFNYSNVLNIIMLEEELRERFKPQYKFIDDSDIDDLSFQIEHGLITRKQLDL